MRPHRFALLTSAITLAGCANTVAPPVALGVGAPPVIDEVSERTIRPVYDNVVREFHFHDPDGDVRFIHREIFSTNGPFEKAVDGVVNIPPDMQKRGAIYVGATRCGPNSYYVKMRAYMIDEAGNRSNTVEYTNHCNGG